MNVSDMKEYTGLLARQALRANVNPAPNWLTYLNGALADWSFDTEYNIEQATVATVINQMDYTLVGQAWKYLSDVLYNSGAGVGATVLYKTNEGDERARNPLYLLQSMGVVQRYYMPSPAVLRLLPAPSETVNLLLQGVRQAPPLVLDTDVPAFPETWHDVLCYRAASKYLDAFAVSELDAAQVAKFDMRYKEAKKDCKRWLDNDDAQLQRTVQARFPDRVQMSIGAPIRTR